MASTSSIRGAAILVLPKGVFVRYAASYGMIFLPSVMAIDSGIRVILRLRGGADKCLAL